MMWDDTTPRKFLEVCASQLVEHWKLRAIVQKVTDSQQLNAARKVYSCADSDAHDSFDWFDP